MLAPAIFWESMFHLVLVPHFVVQYYYDCDNVVIICNNEICPRFSRKQAERTSDLSGHHHILLSAMRTSHFLAFLVATRFVHWSEGFQVPYHTNFRSQARAVPAALDSYRPRAASSISIATLFRRRRRRNHIWTLALFLSECIRRLFPRYAIYVLELENAKYYVGSTAKFRQRIRQHFDDLGGSRWTRRHRPVRVVETHRFVPEKYYLGLEAQVTARYMLKYGVQNVRGAMFCSSRDWTLDDASALVGFLGHYNDQCYQSVRSVVEQQLSSMLPNPTECPSESQSPALRTAPKTAVTLRRKPAPKDRCFYCGELGHWRRNCPHYLVDNEGF